MIISDCIENRNHLRTTYPKIDAYNEGYIEVDDIHTIYYSEAGNPNGSPVLFLHGGPGSGCNPESREFFDPEHYRIILLDQRGAGNSTPTGETRNNTTKLLIKDIETLRETLNIEKWHIFGGSWGSTLSLCYAIEYPENIISITLRGIFLMREKEIKWFTHDARKIFPEAYEELISHLSDDEKEDALKAYYNRLQSDNEDIYIPASIAWNKFENEISSLIPLKEEELAFVKEHIHTSYCVSKIETHWFINNRFKNDNYILENIDNIRKIPAIIVQGRYDVVCPIESAYDLHKAWPEAKFVVVPNAGHSSFEEGITHELIKATDEFKNL